MYKTTTTKQIKADITAIVQDNSNSNQKQISTATATRAGGAKK